MMNNESFIILPSDKNLGPTIMERQAYIEHILHDHLEKGSTYIRLHENTAKNNINAVKLKIVSLICNEFCDVISSEEMDFFNKNLDSSQRIPQF